MGGQKATLQWGRAQRKHKTYRSDVVLQHSGNGHGMFSVLLRNDRQGPDLNAIVRNEIFQRTLIVLCDLIRDEARHG